jgi:hypothetical protein
MNGIFASSGFDYQKEVSLFLILKYLIEQKLIDAELEIKIKDRNEEKIEMDLFISINKQGNEHKFLYEIKEGRDIRKKKELRKVFRKFHKIYNQDNAYKFILVHSCLAEEELLKLTDKTGKWIKENICRDKNICNNSKCTFLNTIGILFLPRNTLGENLSGYTTTDIELRIIEQIKDVLTRFQSSERISQEEAEKIYRSILNEIKSKISKIASAYREDLSYKNRLIPKNLQIGLNSLIYTKGGFIDYFMKVDKFRDNNRYPRIIGESPRDIAFKKFCETFRLNNLSVPHN